MSWLLTALGALLVVVALRDIFRTLWFPEGFGRIAHTVCRAAFAATKPLGRPGRPNQLSGPLGLLSTVLVWTVLVVVGFALVYWPHLPAGFHFGSSLDPSRSSGFLDAVYVSLTALATLGLGDILPATTALRIVLPVQALVGFVLLTAAISWVLQVYPALGRRRALARRLSVLGAADTSEVVRRGDPGAVSPLLHDLGTALSQAQEDLMLYAETYFFRERSPERSLAATLPVALHLVEAGRTSAHAEVRHAASVLRRSTDNLAAALAEQYLGELQDTGEILRAFATDHQHPDSSDPAPA